MRLTRVHTTAGTHPYEEVTWERSDIRLTNWRDGSVNFEQADVEFPVRWSVHARNIVATKYFRGASGSPEREDSLKTLIDRVVSTYVRAGVDGGYFDRPEDGVIFKDELTWLLLHQHFAFNSPVWFNVGTASPQQVSACQPYDALISTETGLVKIGDLVTGNAVGTKVLSASGPAQILAVKSNGIKDVLRLHLHSGHHLDVTADHLVWKANGRAGFVPAGQLKAKDQLHWFRTPELDSRAGDPLRVAEAALAGWLLTDGFVGQYDHGTNRSLTVEPHTINEAERVWVEAALELVWPDLHSHKRTAETLDPKVDFCRIRYYGEALRPFVQKWALLTRGVEAKFPEYLLTAPQAELTAFLKSVFQADGYVIEDGSQIGLSMESEHLMRGIQQSLLRYGIFARLHNYEDGRGDRHSRWTLSIKVLGDQQLFADAIGFLSEDKTSRLAAGLTRKGVPATEGKRVQLVSIENLGPQEVYDIQTDAEEYLSHGFRVHNCFILGVEDSMDSILNWYREEGLIFKGGSGSGINLSSLRSSKELLSSGGTASGPVSFMRGADASAGTIKSGGATRRAAKMVILDVDHPDIQEFIDTKVREEAKIRVLRDAGFDMDLGGEDAFSVQYQNANNSVRVNDEFMTAVENEAGFPLLRRNGSIQETIDARKLWTRLAEAAHACADPGVQYDGSIQKWHTSPADGRITASNPCSEYMHVDNSSCNLASINLLKYRSENGTFLADEFELDTRLVFLAMDISINFADFPTKKIEKMTKKYRQLGIGYANLGALLMSLGFGYNSAGGRALTAAITSLLTATAYHTSTELAKDLEPYPGWKNKANQAAHHQVITQHRDAADALVAALDGNTVFIHPDVVSGVEAAEALRLADKAAFLWEECVNAPAGFRNAQASLLAPTGTIGFMMDCDTTGGEPDFSLVKNKKLVGGGSMQIVNQAVPMALAHLGYDDAEQTEILDFVNREGHVLGAPYLKEEHLEVFDTAVGERAISPMGHVLMMAAMQPFLSGAISKTVNMPSSTTVEDVEDIYFAGWKLGLKALAIYRDGTKVGQPLDVKQKPAEELHRALADEADFLALQAQIQELETQVKKLERKPAREKLPLKRRGNTYSFNVGGAKAYLSTGEYADGRLGEVFITMSKQGSTLAGIMDGFATSVSIGLQYGVPLEVLLRKFKGSRFEPAGMTTDPEIRMADSLLDYLAKRLALDYLPREIRDELGIYSRDERALMVQEEVEHEQAVKREEVAIETVRSIPNTEQSAPMSILTAPAAKPNKDYTGDAPFCPSDGSPMRRAGACYVCEECGSSSGCS